MIPFKSRRFIAVRVCIITIQLIFIDSVGADTIDSTTNATVPIMQPTVDSLTKTVPADTVTSYSLPWNGTTKPDSIRQRPDTATVTAATSLTDTTLPPRIVLRPKKKPLSIFSPRESLYVGISPEQDYVARRYVSQIFAFSWGDAEKTAKRLQRIEHKDHLPPLSALLTVSARVFRILNGEYENDQERLTLQREVDETASKSVRLLTVKSHPDSLAPLLLFIDGGIRGLCAALKIEKNAVEAAIDGLTALNRLEQLLELSPDIDDASLGYGLFYCSLARAPAIVRAALNIGNHPVSFDGGLDYLRRSAYHGRYTSELAKLYLIQFLSPYWGHLTEEKDRLFASLQKRYPDNPYYVFLATDEDICFHPERINGAYIASLEKQLYSWKNGNYSQKRYRALITYQLHFFDTASAIDSGRISGDTTINLREFTFYPQFLEALGEKRRHSPDDNNHAAHKREPLTKGASEAMRSLGLSAMSGARKNLYEWHLRDALKLQ